MANINGVRQISSRIEYYFLPRPERGSDRIFLPSELEVEDEAEAFTDAEAEPKPLVCGTDTERARTP